MDDQKPNPSAGGRYVLGDDDQHVPDVGAYEKHLSRHRYGNTPALGNTSALDSRSGFSPTCRVETRPTTPEVANEPAETGEPSPAATVNQITKFKREVKNVTAQ